MVQCMNLNEQYRIIAVTYHNGDSRATCGSSSVIYSKYLGLTGKILLLERGQAFLMDELRRENNLVIRGLLLQTSPVLDFIYNSKNLLVATQNSIYRLIKVL